MFSDGRGTPVHPMTVSSGSPALGVRCSVKGEGWRVEGVAFRVKDVGCRVQGVGCKVYRGTSPIRNSPPPRTFLGPWV